MGFIFQEIWHFLNILYKEIRYCFFSPNIYLQIYIYIVIIFFWNDEITVGPDFIIAPCFDKLATYSNTVQNNEL